MTWVGSYSASVSGLGFVFCCFALAGLAAGGGCYFSDLETCFKLIPAPLYREALRVRETGFGAEAEVTGKLLRRGIRPFEVPISYKARSREAWEKLTWRDGVEAMWILLRERFVTRPVRTDQETAR